MKEILLAYKKERATAQIAHLFFADMQNANPKNQKSYFFANAEQK